MKRLTLAAAFAGLALLGACATATPYQQALTASDSGYSEQKIEDNRFQVQFEGNSLTDRKTVETYLLYRAAELTKQSGYDHFRVVRRDTDSNTRLVGSPSAYDPFYDHFYLNYRYFGPRAAYFHDPYRRYYPGPAYYSRWGAYDPFWGGPGWGGGFGGWGGWGPRWRYYRPGFGWGGWGGWGAGFGGDVFRIESAP